MIVHVPRCFTIQPAFTGPMVRKAKDIGKAPNARPVRVLAVFERCGLKNFLYAVHRLTRRKSVGRLGQDLEESLSHFTLTSSGDFGHYTLSRRALVS